jgi:hypothetical protein
MNEKSMSFDPRAGHNHDGINSAPVHITEKSVGIEHLTDEAIEFLQEGSAGVTGDGTVIVETDDTEEVESNLAEVEPLYVEVTVAAGESETITTSWVSSAIVRTTRLIMSENTEANLTVFHKSTYAEEDKEFKASGVGNGFLWEGLWAHYDEEEGGNAHIKIENTGLVASTFYLTLESATLAANRLVVNSLGVSGEDDPKTGAVTLSAGSGVTIASTGNDIEISASGGGGGILNRLFVGTTGSWSLEGPSAVELDTAFTVTYPDSGLIEMHLNFSDSISGAGDTILGIVKWDEGVMAHITVRDFFLSQDLDGTTSHFSLSTILSGTPNETVTYYLGIDAGGTSGVVHTIYHTSVIPFEWWARAA